MKVAHLQVTNFRSLQNLDLNFDQDFVILVGPNGSGKTSVLECIFYSSVLQAFPPSKSWELIRFGETFFRIKSKVESLDLEYYYGKKDEKRFERSQTIDGARKKAGEVLGQMPTVTFLPQDLNILQLSPGLRREYLDEILLQTESGYEKELSDYAKILLQRNELLGRIRATAANEKELDFWDEKLSAAASKITISRQKLADFMAENLMREYRGLVGEKLECTFTYLPTAKSPDEEGFLEALYKNRRVDIASARTGIGPHRDDWKITNTDTKDLAHYLSRGQQRSVVMALKIIEAGYLHQVLKKHPIFLLDELLAELDPARKKSVVKNLPEETQKFLTTTDLSEIPSEVIEKAQVIELGAY